jgi:5-methylcytosine-specific restriction endonuclease McrA
MGAENHTLALSERQRQDVWFRDDGTCQLCGHPGNEIDHIEAKKMGGRKGEWNKWIDRAENLRLLCHACHYARHHGNQIGGH